MGSGVAKSGSPAPKPITSRPAALSALALASTARVADSLIAAIRADTRAGDGSAMRPSSQRSRARVHRVSRRFDAFDPSTGLDVHWRVRFGLPWKGMESRPQARTSIGEAPAPKPGVGGSGPSRPSETNREEGQSHGGPPH